MAVVHHELCFIQHKMLPRLLLLMICTFLGLACLAKASTPNIMLSILTG